MIRIMICDDEQQERKQLIKDVQQWCEKRTQPALIEFCENWSDLAEKIKCRKPDLLIIANNGVAGLDLVTNALALMHKILWFSDLDFSLQAYRLCLPYFCQKPLTSAKVEYALDRIAEQRPAGYPV